MGIKITVNEPHVVALKRALAGWLAFVGFGLIVGASKNPRPDEILFMITLPLIVIIPYAIWSVAIAALRVYWPVSWQWPIGLGLLRPDQCIRHDTRTKPERRLPD